MELDSQQDLRERRVYLEGYLIEVLLNRLPPRARLQAKTESLRRRIQAVKELKADQGNPDWNWSSGQALDDKDDIVQAFLGPGTWTLYLPEVLTEQLASLPLTDENVPAIERALNINTVAAVEKRRQHRTSWWTPIPLWT